MPKLPVISGHEAVKAFIKIGYQPDHQTGSHIILRHINPPHRRLTVPNHKELNKKTLKKIINQAGLTVVEFVSLL
ncbi:MAG: type II toxin-antitoxin system HicA family toxin [Candidatus Aenigmarchaeota archaeon]|nr:type II toxin-antitoxin system HicA family toxin [Candidatus Aenigmarchaeota archaeon]